jgi:hypothetical protein
MEAVYSSETPVNVYQTTWRHIPEYRTVGVANATDQQENWHADFKPLERTVQGFH